MSDRVWIFVSLFGLLMLFLSVDKFTGFLSGIVFLSGLVPLTGNWRWPENSNAD